VTRITDPVTRETATLCASDRPIVVTLFPQHLEIFEKRTRARFAVEYDKLLVFAQQTGLRRVYEPKAADP